MTCRLHCPRCRIEFKPFRLHADASISTLPCTSFSVTLEVPRSASAIVLGSVSRNASACKLISLPTSVSAFHSSRVSLSKSYSTPFSKSPSEWSALASTSQSNLTSALICFHFNQNVDKGFSLHIDQCGAKCRLIFFC